ncbi:response regulator [Roseivivax sp.]
MKILLVDNERDIISLVEIALEIEDDIELTTATSGREGLALIEAQRFDGFLFDLMMPKPDGHDLLAGVRASELNADRPVIICTAKSEAHASAELQAAGATKILPKPFDPRRLADVIRSVVAG